MHPLETCLIAVGVALLTLGHAPAGITWLDFGLLLPEAERRRRQHRSSVRQTTRRRMMIIAICIYLTKQLGLLPAHSRGR